MKKYRRVISYDTEEWCKVWRKTVAVDLKNDMTNLVNFNASSDKSEHLHFDVLLLSIVYKVSTKKVQKSYLLWHWRVIQTMKKNSLLVWKMTWEIWWILTRAVKNLKICTSMWYLLSKVCNVWAKIIQTHCVVKNDLWFQKWHKKFG